MASRPVAVLAAALACACHPPPSGERPDAGQQPDGGHPVPGPGIAAAWQVSDPKDLVPGPSTHGQAGDWVMANSRVRFVIEGAHPSDGYDPYGCSTYVGMAMNRGLRHWVEGSGFDFDFSDLARVNTSADFYAAVGERVSYSVLNLDAPFSPIVNFAHVLIGQYPQTTLPPGHSTTFRFVFAVGAGDTGTLQEAHRAARGAASPLVPLSGSVTDVAGAPVPAARVHVYTGGPGSEIVAAFARTGADGRWTAPVVSGNYLVRALADDRPAGAPRAIAVPPQGLTGLALQLGAPARIAVAARDPAGFALPAKIVAEPAGATARLQLPAAFGEMWDRQPIVVFSPAGDAVLPVFPGSWKVTISRGFEYDRPVIGPFAVGAGETRQVSAQLARMVDTAGWMSADFHVHAQLSPDADDLLAEKVRAFAAEGVEIPVSTDHEIVGDFGPAARALSLIPFMHPVAGTEMTTTFVGHFNLFPLAPDARKPNAGALVWYQRDLPDVFAEARARLTPDGLAPIVQMNHPRTPQMGYLDAMQFDPGLFAVQANPGHWTTRWDAMEVWNGVALRLFEGCPPQIAEPGCVAPAHPTAFDWFSFLDRGLRVTGTGNSDSHTASLREVGYPRTYVRVGEDDPSAVTDAALVAAVRGMRATISGGPFLIISAPANGSSGERTGPGGQVAADRGVVHLHVELQAPPWMGPLSRVDIWRGDTTAQGGTLIRSIPLNDPGTATMRVDTDVDVPVPVDTWLLATARGTDVHALWPVVQSAVPPFALTNPIFVDADGDGRWTPLR